MISKEVAQAEQGAWREVAPGWRQLYGDFDRLGVSIEWHDFRIARPLDWGRSFHRHSLEFCLNLSGRGAVGAHGQRRSDYHPGNSGYYAIANEPVPASRQAHDHHQFVTLEFSREHLQKQFVQDEAGLEPEIRRVIFGDKNGSVVAPARPMSTQQRDVVASLAEPPVTKAAQILWYQSKALELMAHFLFAPKDPEFFCMRKNASRANASSEPKNCWRAIWRTRPPSKHLVMKSAAVPFISAGFSRAKSASPFRNICAIYEWNVRPNCCGRDVTT